MTIRRICPKPWIAALCLAAGVATWAVAQQFTYRDKGGNMAISGLTSWKIERVSDDLFKFEGGGNPFTGTWKQQRLTVRGRTISGTAKRASGSSFELSEAEMAGGVSAHLQSESGNSWLEGAKLTLSNSAPSATVVLTGDVHVRRGAAREGEGTDLWTSSAKVEMASLGSGAKDPVKSISTQSNFRIVQTLARGDAMTVTATGQQLTFDVPKNAVEARAGLVVKGQRRATEGPQRFEVSAPSGTVSLFAAGQSPTFPVRAFALDGGVKMSLHTDRRDKAGKLDPVDLSGRCRSITYNDAERTMRMVGDVYLEGSDNAIFGTIEHANEAIIRLDESRNFKSVELRGDPGASTVREQKKP